VETVSYSNKLSFIGGNPINEVHLRLASAIGSVHALVCRLALGSFVPAPWVCDHGCNCNPAACNSHAKERPSPLPALAGRRSDFPFPQLLWQAVAPRGSWPVPRLTPPPPRFYHPHLVLS
jgi:hypothetical protein